MSIQQNYKSPLVWIDLQGIVTPPGVQDGDETSVDSITFSVNITSPSLILTDSDGDNIVYPFDTIIVTATFEAVQNTPKVNFQV